MGTIGILNVGAGDTKITFDKSNPAECIRAGRIVTDMLRRGYALLIEVKKGKFERVKKFDPKTSSYIIADFDPKDANEPEPSAQAASKVGAPRGRKPKMRAIPASSVSGTAVARTAGG